METNGTLAAPEEVKKPVHRRRLRGKTVALIAVCAAAALLAAAYIAVCAVAQGEEAVRAGVSVLGVDMGGLSLEEAESLWRRAGKGACRDTVILVMADGQTVGEISLADLAVTVTPEDAGKAAWNVGRSNSFLGGGFAYLKSRAGSHNVIPHLTVNENGFSAALKRLDQLLDCTAVDGSYRLDPEKTDEFYLIKPRDGISIDLDLLASMLENAVTNGDLRTIECVGERLAAKPLDVDALYESLHAEGVNAGYDQETGELTEEKIGVEFDKEQAKALLESAKPGEEIAVPAQLKFPAVTKAALKDVLFRDCLGSYTTVASGSANRRHNVELAAKTVNGTVLNTGERFSYNNAVGDTGKELGYYPAPAYVGGKSVDVYGGGVCQVSSTMYYAVLLSNLKIVERWCHQYAPGYITWGIDATTYYPWVDFVFENDTDYPIKIVTHYDSRDRITVEIYGTKTDDSYVRITNSVLSSTPSYTKYVEDPKLAEGKEEVEQSGYTGYYVRTWRNVYAGDGTLLSSTVEANSDYEMRPTIIRVGPKKQADPTPADPPEPPSGGDETGGGDVGGGDVGGGDIGGDVGGGDAGGGDAGDSGDAGGGDTLE